MRLMQERRHFRIALSTKSSGFISRRSGREPTVFDIVKDISEVWYQLFIHLFVFVFKKEGNARCIIQLIGEHTQILQMYWNDPSLFVLYLCKQYIKDMFMLLKPLQAPRINRK